MTIANKLSGSVSTIIVVLSRLMVATILMIPIIIGNGGLKVLRTKFPFLHIARIILGISAMSCTYYAYSRLPISLATAIGFSGPLITTLLAVIIMREYVEPKKWILIIIGYIGVLIEIRPGTLEFDPATIVEIIANVLAGLTLILTKKLSSKDSPLTLLTFANCGGFIIVFAIISILYFSNSIDKDMIMLPTIKLEFILLIILGFFGAFSQYARIKALQNAEVSFVAPFEYTRMVLAVPIDIFIIGVIPDTWTMVGAAIIIFASFTFGMMSTKK